MVVLLVACQQDGVVCVPPEGPVPTGVRPVVHVVRPAVRSGRRVRVAKTLQVKIIKNLSFLALLRTIIMQYHYRPCKADNF